MPLARGATRDARDALERHDQPGRGCPVRRRLPSRRQVDTCAPRLAGHRVHVSIGRYADGSPGEVWIDMHADGAPLRGMAHALARLASIALQEGVSVASVAHALRGHCGLQGVVEDCDGITEALSVPDLVGQILERVS
jgi:ribonucleoside-diphosphate reductase alpha chain